MPAGQAPSTIVARQQVLPVRAILTDVDGTLYRQSFVRRRMFLELFRMSLLSPLRGWRTAKAIRAYRQSQEELRAESFHGDAGAEQMRRACASSRLAPEFVAKCVEEWMEQRPLESLREALFSDIPTFFEWCRQQDIRIAAVSDYDPRRKLDALGLARYFDAVVFAQQAAVGRFKPDPRALRAALKELEVPAGEALYVGDRADVDVTAAQRAGIPAVLLQTDARAVSADCLVIQSFMDLREIIENRKAHSGSEPFRENRAGLA